MTRTATTTPQAFGSERQPVAIVDDFAADPEALRAAASTARFAPARAHYPGLRAPLPANYLARQLPIVAQAARTVLGFAGDLVPIDASFSLVTRAPGALTLRQRLPHCDASDPNRIALVHFLSHDEAGGTAFFRHRSTGFETIDPTRAPEYAARLEQELADPVQWPAGYVDGDTALFERIGLCPARYNRAAIYRSFALHSGAIAPGTVLSPDPAVGRLTVTGFFSVIGESEGE